MAKFYYNGVLLPEIPQEADYPYCTITYMYVHEEELYGDFVMVEYTTTKTCVGKNDSGNDAMMYPTSGHQKTYEYDVESDSWIVMSEGEIDTSLQAEIGKDDVMGFEIYWSNYDIPYGSADSTEIYRAASDPVPFEEKKYEIKESTLKAIADSIRIKTGKTDLITPENMPSEIDGISSGGGLENGYDVMFYDENNEALAFYSIKQGHSIESPIYDCKAWQMEDGTGVSFPYTPTGDLVVYANNDTYASQLYAFYNIDPVIYPYLIITAGRGTNIMIRFGQSIGNNTTTYLLFNKVYYGSGNATISDYSDIASVVSAVTQEIPTLRYDKSYAMNSGSGWYHYQNFDSNLDDGTVKYSLA